MFTTPEEKQGTRSSGTLGTPGYHNARSKDSDISQGIVNQGALKQRETTGTIVIPLEGRGGKKGITRLCPGLQNTAPSVCFFSCCKLTG